MVDATVILAALEAQLGCYQRLARLAGQQRECVQQGSTELLLRLLEARQQVLDELARLEITVGPVRRQWSDVAPRLAAEQRAHAEALLLGCRQLLEQITASDQDDVMLLQQRKLNVGRQITATTTGRQVHRAYAGAASAAPGRVDVSQ